MKFRIKKAIMLLTDGTKKVLKRETPTNDIEAVRATLKECYGASVVMFTYTEFK